MNIHTPSTPLAVFWFRRDLRLEDNAALYRALSSGLPVLPLFIFDRNILDALPDRRDPRVSFIYNALRDIHHQLRKTGSGIRLEHGYPVEIWQKLLKELNIRAVFFNRDYEPYARQRDAEVEHLLNSAGVPVYSGKDQVIFEPEEVVKPDGTPYQVYTPYRRQWLKKLLARDIPVYPSEKLLEKFVRNHHSSIPELKEMGFQPSSLAIPPKNVDDSLLKSYHQNRDYPAREGTSRLGVHLRFGTISIRRAVAAARELNETWLHELIWREFFMMLLWHFPHTAEQPFRSTYRNFPWRKDEAAFRRWCEGTTGFPLVDAGMRELNQTGYMHNRVRMVTANFLTRLLLIDWRMGERYFAEMLLDFELASNVGNWQWSAGCGADAAPYFRIFNPETQIQKFDAEKEYIRRWIPEYGGSHYPRPMLDYPKARRQALAIFKAHLGNLAG